MKRGLLRSISLTARNFRHSCTKTNKQAVQSFTPLASSTRSRLRFYSSELDFPDTKKPNPAAESPSLPQAHVKDVALDVEDVSNKELKMRIEKYFEGDEEALPSILEDILWRKLVGKHEETDDELMDEMVMQPIDVVDLWGTKSLNQILKSCTRLMKRLMICMMPGI